MCLVVYPQTITLAVVGGHVDPDRVETWIPLVRDTVIFLVGTFMLVYSVFLDQPNPLIIGAGLTLLGVPAAIRLDVKRRTDNGKNGN